SRRWQDSGLTQVAAQKLLQDNAESCHPLEGRVDPSSIAYAIHRAGAAQLHILEPLAPIVSTAFQAPYCRGVEVEVRTL
ncbi:baseplate J protein, partial [Pseudomonas sp. RTS2]|nr:baseplate J protein [Pseudomonas sp. RTS2]